MKPGYLLFLITFAFLLHTAGSCEKQPVPPEPGPEPPAPDLSVARISETGQGYDSFQDALKAANASAAPATIILRADCSTPEALIFNSSGAKVTIDLAGHKLEAYGTLTVKSETEITDSSAPGDGTPGKGEMLAPNSPVLTATDAASLTISGGNIVCSKDSVYTVRTEEGASTTVCGSARIVSEKYRTLYLYGSETAVREASLTVKGGWIECAEGQNCITTTRTTASGAHRICYLNVSGGHFRHAGSDYSSTRRCIYRGYDNCLAKVSGGFFDTGDIYRHGSQSVHNYTAEGASIESTEKDFPQEFAAGYTHYVKMARGVDAAHAAIRKVFEDAGTANLAVYATKGGKPIYSAAFGYRCKEKGNVDTLEFHDIFRIASISKSFTGAAMMLLVEQGKVDVKDKVNDYFARLPEDKRFTVVNPAYPDVPITIEMLLNHTASIQGSKYGVEEFSKNITYTSNKPGTVYDYSNMGTTVAGAIVEIASGERLDKFVKANFLDKIGMSYSDYDPDRIDTLGGPRFTHLYGETGTRYYTGSAYKPLFTASQEANYVLGYNTGLISPPGNMKTNAEQLMKWARTLQAGGVSPDGVRVLSEESVRKMHNNTGPGSRYGYYLYSSLSRIPGKVTAGHNGGAYGAHTSMYYGLSFDAAGNMVPPAPGSGDDWVVIVLSSGGTAGETLEDDITRIIYYTLVETNQYSSAVL
ncbi:MAG: beta-lactamase family protein [Bacteroidales bacterium]|nr:beta-lactamase family protein [Bacteroidales bacterium]